MSITFGSNTRYPRQTGVAGLRSSPEMSRVVLNHGYDISIFVAIPCLSGDVKVGCLTSLLQFSLMCRDYSLGCELALIPGESLIARARNAAVAMFLASKHTHLLFLDNDISFAASDLANMLEADVDVIAGACPKKTIQSTYTVQTVIGNYNGLVEVSGVGTGLMLIKRDVLHKMIEYNSELKIEGPPYLSVDEDKYSYALFDTSLFDGHFVSEDLTFCMRWKDLGGKTYVLPRMKLGHHGSHVYTGTYSV